MPNTMTSIKIADLQPSVQARVLKNQEKFNPDKDNTINQSELSTLLAEYGNKTIDDLTTYGECFLGTYSDKTNDYIYTAKEEAEIKSLTQKKMDSWEKEIGRGVGYTVGGITGFVGVLGLLSGAFASAPVTLSVIAAGGAIAAIGYGFDYIRSKWSAEEDVQVATAKETDAEVARANELKQREEDVTKKEQELETREIENQERFSKASVRINNELQKAEQKAKNINTELDKK